MYKIILGKKINFSKLKMIPYRKFSNMVSSSVQDDILKIVKNEKRYPTLDDLQIICNNNNLPIHETALITVIANLEPGCFADRYLNDLNEILSNDFLNMQANILSDKQYQEMIRKLIIKMNTEKLYDLELEQLRVKKNLNNFERFMALCFAKLGKRVSNDFLMIVNTTEV